MRKALLIGAAALYFLAAAIYMSYPLIVGMADTVGNPYLGLEGAYWIGEGAKIWTHPRDLWNATFFFPHRKTLMTNQWILGLYLVAGPIYLLSRNAILAVNAYSMATYFLNGLCMFFLARRLLSSTYGALVAGFVFAYCPFRFSAPMLAGIMSNFWICLALLFLHRFMVPQNADRGGGMGLSPDALLFAIFFGLQFITDPFTGIFYSLMVGLYLICRLFAGGLRFTPRLVLNAALALALISCIVSPLFYPYMEMMSTRGAEDMARGTEESQVLSCDLVSYLLAPPTNFLYGWIPHCYKISRPQYLFPGIVAAFLFVVGLTRRKGSAIKKSGERAFLVALAVAGILISFGPYISWGGHRICPGPYLPLYHWCPFFRSLRAIGWAAQLWLIPFSIFCGGGAAALVAPIAKVRRRVAAGAAIMFVILLEYFNKNAAGDYFTAQNYRVDLRVPDVYEWLKRQPGDFGVIELPMPDNDGEFEASGSETYYMFWSLYHGKRIVNGSSSFRPPEYWPLIDVMARFPSRESLAVLGALGVRYVIVHTERYDYDPFEHRKIGSGAGQRVVESAIRRGSDLLPVGKFGESRVFELLPVKMAPHPGGAWREIKPGPDWKTTGTINQGCLPRIFDGDPATAWTVFHGCNLYNNNNMVEIDMGGLHDLSRIVVRYPSFRAFPRGMTAEVSEDGKSWKTIDTLPAYAGLVIGLINDPSKRQLDVVFAPCRARYLRLIQTLPSLWWSISELHLYSGAEGDKAEA